MKEQKKKLMSRVFGKDKAIKMLKDDGEIQSDEDHKDNDEEKKK